MITAFDKYLIKIILSKQIDKYCHLINSRVLFYTTMSSSVKRRLASDLTEGDSIDESNQTNEEIRVRLESIAQKHYICNNYLKDISIDWFSLRRKVNHYYQNTVWMILTII